MKKIDWEKYLNVIYSSWDKIKIKIPEKVSSPIDKQITKVKMLDLNKQLGVWGGIAFGLIVLFYLTMCSGSATSNIKYDDSSEKNLAKHEAMIEKQRKEDEKKEIEDFKILSTSAKIKHFYENVSLNYPENKELREKLDKILRKDIKKAKTFEEYKAIADGISHYSKMMMDYKFSENDIKKFKLLAIKEAKNKDEYDSIGFKDSELTPNEKIELAKIGVPKYFYKYQKELNEKSKDEAANFVLGVVKGGKTEYTSLLLQYPESPAVCKYFAKNMTEANEKLLKGSPILFEYYIKKGKIDEAVAVASEGTGKGESNGVPVPVRKLMGGFNVFKTISTLAFDGNKDAIELMDRYCKSRRFDGMEKSEFDIIIKYNFFKELKKFEGSKKDENACKDFAITSQKFLLRDKKLDRTASSIDSLLTVIPSDETRDYVCEKILKKITELGEKDEIALIKNACASTFLSKNQKDDFFKKGVDLIVSSETPVELRNRIEILKIGDFIRDNFDYLLGKLDNSNGLNKAILMYCNVKGLGTDKNYEKAKEIFRDIVLHPQPNLYGFYALGYIGFNFRTQKDADIDDFYRYLYDDISKDRKADEPNLNALVALGMLKFVPSGGTFNNCINIIKDSAKKSDFAMLLYALVSFEINKASISVIGYTKDENVNEVLVPIFQAMKSNEFDGNLATYSFAMFSTYIYGFNGYASAIVGVQTKISLMEIMLKFAIETKNQDLKYEIASMVLKTIRMNSGTALSEKFELNKYKADVATCLRSAAEAGNKDAANLLRDL